MKNDIPDISCERGLAPYGGRSKQPRLCSVEGCDERHYCQSLCKIHYDRWRKHGDPHKVITDQERRHVVLDWETVAIIRARRAAGETVSAIARDLKLNRSTASKAALATNWAAPGARTGSGRAK